MRLRRLGGCRQIVGHRQSCSFEVEDPGRTLLEREVRGAPPATGAAQPERWAGASTTGWFPAGRPSSRALNSLVVASSQSPPMISGVSLRASANGATVCLHLVARLVRMVSISKHPRWSTSALACHRPPLRQGPDRVAHPRTHLGPQRWRDGSGGCVLRVSSSRSATGRQPLVPWSTKPAQRATAG